MVDQVELGLGCQLQTWGLKRRKSATEEIEWALLQKDIPSSPTFCKTPPNLLLPSCLLSPSCCQKELAPGLEFQ